MTEIGVAVLELSNEICSHSGWTELCGNARGGVRGASLNGLNVLDIKPEEYSLWILWRPSE